jgi:hypothetical protein
MAAEGGHDPQPALHRSIRFRGGPVPLYGSSAMKTRRQAEVLIPSRGVSPTASASDRARRPCRFTCHVRSVSARPTLLTAFPGDGVRHPLTGPQPIRGTASRARAFCGFAQSRLLGHVLRAEGVRVERAPSRVIRFQGGASTTAAHPPWSGERESNPHNSWPPARRLTNKPSARRCRGGSATSPARTTLPRREHPVAEAPGGVGKLSPRPEPRASR